MWCIGAIFKTIPLNPLGRPVMEIVLQCTHHQCNLIMKYSTEILIQQFKDTFYCSMSRKGFTKKAYLAKYHFHNNMLLVISSSLGLIVEIYPLFLTHGVTTGNYSIKFICKTINNKSTGSELNIAHFNRHIHITGLVSFNNILIGK